MRNIYALDFNFDVQTRNWLRKKGPYLQLLTHFVSFDILEWMLLEQVDECEWLSIFVSREKWGKFSMGTNFFDFLPIIKREMLLFTRIGGFLIYFSVKGGEYMNLFWGRSCVTATYTYVPNTVHS